MSTAGPMETFSVPSAMTWHFAVMGIFVIASSILFSIVGLVLYNYIIILTGFIGIIVFKYIHFHLIFNNEILFSVGILTCLIFIWLPKNKISSYSPSALTSTFSLYIGSFLITFVLNLSWPAILFWLLSGNYIFGLYLQLNSESKLLNFIFLKDLFFSFAVIHGAAHVWMIDHIV